MCEGGLSPRGAKVSFTLVWRNTRFLTDRDNASRPIGFHQTIMANIRFHLYGGPQGWNPHSFGPERRARWVINPSNHVGPRRRSHTIQRPGRARVEMECISGRGELDHLIVRIPSYAGVLHKGVEPSPRKVEDGDALRGRWGVHQWHRVNPGHLTSFAFYSNGGLRIRPSNRPPHRDACAWQLSGDLHCRRAGVERRTG